MRKNPSVIEYQATITSYLGAAALAAAQADARAKFPEESCGFITDGVYVVCENKSKTPLTDFEITDPRYDAAVLTGRVKAIIHSHPNGPIFPSAHDMTQQLATNVPWAIISLNENVISKTVVWGGNIPTAPILGRPFLHGIFDCYSLIRDVFALGTEGMKAQGIGWPLPPIELAQFPRDDSWWKSEQDLYGDNFKGQGFKIIQRNEARPGDAFLIAVGDSRGNPHKRLNHAGLLVDTNMLLHHLPARNSRREPAGIWARSADIWVRYEAPK